MPNYGKLLTGLQIGTAVVGGLGTIAVTKSIFDEALELAPYVIGGTAMIGWIIVVIKFA